MQDDGTVAVLGSLNMDIVIRVEHLPRRGETLAALDVSQHAGGKGANQAAAAAKAGGRVRMMGAVGQDAFGASLLDTLNRLDVDTSAVARLGEGRTGTAYVVVETSGENQILVHGGANLMVGAALAAGAPPGATRLAQLETPLDAVKAFLHGAGGRRMLNAAPYVEAARDLFTELDLLIVNETELSDYAGAARTVEGAKAAEALARALLCREGQRIIVTLGADGLIAVGADDTIRLPGRPAKVVDTTGAGDCFCGVLAAGLSKGLDLRSALERANAAAAISVTRLGAISSMPSAEEIEAALVG